MAITQSNHPTLADVRHMPVGDVIALPFENLAVLHAEAHDASDAAKRLADWIEAAIAHTEEQLGVYVSAAETARLTALADDLRSQLAAFTAEWEDLTMQLDGQGALP